MVRWLFIALLSGSSLLCQPVKFEWIDDCCTLVGTFDSTEVSRVQLQNALDLFGIHSFSYIEHTPLLFKPQSKELQESKFFLFLHEIEEKSEKLTALELPVGALFQEALKKETLELYDRSVLATVLFDALIDEDFEQLRKLPWHNENRMLEQYVSALTGSDKHLIEIFQGLVIKMAARNGDSKSVLDQANNMLKAENWRELLSIEIITYGWYNEAIQGIQVHEEKQTYNELFLPLFQEIEFVDCCEP